MALVLADRVLETSTSEGLGTFALAGAQTGYQTFSSGIGNGNTCYYTINGQTTEQWEVGIGTVGAGTLARTTLISSNTGSFINFVAGVKNVFVTQPASKSIYKDENGNAIPLGSASATQLDITAQGNLRLQDTTGGEYVAIQAPATLASSYTLTMPVDDGTTGQALVTDGSGVLSWSSAASGDVYGPASSTDNAVARYDGTTGKIIQNSAVTIADDGATVIAANSSSDGLRITQIGTGNALLVEDSANPDATPTVITATGAVGIGTSSPSAQLDIYAANSSGTFTSQIFSANNSVAAKTNYVKMDALVAFNPAGSETGGYQLKVLQNNAYKTIIDVNGALVNASNYLAFGTTNEAMRIASNGTISLGGTTGAESLRVTPVTSSVNYLEAKGAVTTGAPVLSAAGSDANIGITLTPKGTGALTTASNVGIGTTTPTAKLSVVGTTHITGANAFPTTGVGIELVPAVAGGTNYIITYNRTGTAWQNLEIASAQTVFGTGGFERMRIASTGTISLGAAPGSESLRVTPVASAVNYLNLQGAITTASPSITAAGSDTNIDIAFTPKGTGNVRFGTYTAGVVVQAGYITIKDAAGNTRNLLVG
jgi:hypothetical protein